MSLPITLVDGEAARTTLDDGSVDFVFLANVSHEVDDHGAALAEFARIVRPAGRLAIFEWPDVDPPPGPPTAHRVPADEVERAMRAAGWSVAGATEPVGPYEYLVIGCAPT